MAKLQLSMEELLQIVRGEVNLPETRENIAKALMTVWKSEQMQTEIEAHAEHLGKVKMERIINDSFKEVKVSSWSSKTEIRGWAVEVIRDQLKKDTIGLIIEALKPEMEKAVNDMFQKQFGAVFIQMMKNQQGQ